MKSVFFEAGQRAALSAVVASIVVGVDPTIASAASESLASRIEKARSVSDMGASVSQTAEDGKTMQFPNFPNYFSNFSNYVPPTGPRPTNPAPRPANPAPGSGGSGLGGS